MTVINHQHQRWTRTERGNSWGMCAPILAADYKQGGAHVAPVGQSHAIPASDLSLTDLPTLQLAGVRSRLFSHSHRARASSPRSVIARFPPARGGCLSSLSGSRQISRSGVLLRQRVRRGGSAFVAAPTSPSLNTKARENAVQSFAHVPECHGVKTLSVCGWRGNIQPREARNAVPENPTSGYCNEC